MDALRRSIRRQQLDAQLLPFADLANTTVPKGGWIRAVREALGLSLSQYAMRLGLHSPSTAHQIEQAETNGSITVKRLEAAADALGCDLVVRLVPRESLEVLVERQAMRKASERLSRLQHTMLMEGQPVGQPEMETLLRKTAADILAQGGNHLWG